MLVPGIKDEYGEGKAIDIVATLNHDLMADAVDGLKPSGFELDKKGGFSANINAAATLLIETSPGEWIEARELFITLSLKGNALT